MNIAAIKPLYRGEDAIENQTMLLIALSLLALAPEMSQQQTASVDPVTPIALPTSQDYALVALPPQARGAATVRVTRRTGTDQLDCMPTDIIGDTPIAVASCNLIMMKMGWMAAVTRKDGTDMSVPVFRVLWEPAPASFQSDFGGATPLALDGKSPSESAGPNPATDLLSHYATPIDATGHPLSCRITLSSGTRKYDETTCLIAMGQRYLPAIDKQGRARRTDVRSWVRFVDRE